MQSGRALFPTSVVLFDLYRSKGSEADTQGIDDIDVLTLINDINRGIQTALDEASEVVLVQPVADHVGSVFFVDGP